MEASVIIKVSDIPFTPNYLDEIIQVNEKYQVWILENLGYRAEYEYSYVMWETTAYLKYTFKNQQDATTFKLKWL